MKRRKPVFMITEDPLQVPNYTPFRFPIPIPAHDKNTDVRCIPLSMWWRRIITGCLMSLNYTDQWQGTEEQQRWAVDQIRRIVADVTLGDECMQQQFRNDPLDPCQIQVSTNGGAWVDAWRDDLCTSPSLTFIFRFEPTTNIYQSSGDGGQTWQDATDTDPRFTTPQDDPPVGVDPFCIAAENARTNLVQRMQDIFNTVEGVGVLAGIFAAVLALIGGWWTFVVAYNNPLIWGLAGLLLASIGSNFDDIFTQEWQDDFLCWLYSAYKIADFDEEQWVNVAVWSYLNAKMTADGTLASQFMISLVNILGATELAYAATHGDATGEICGNCSGWSHDYLAGNGRIPLDSVLLGSYNNLDDRYDGVFEPALFRASVQVNVNFAEQILITRIRQVVTQEVNSPFSVRDHTIHYIDAGGIPHIIVSANHLGSGTFTLDTGIINQPCHGIIFENFSRHAGNPADFIRLIEAHVEGEETDPFTP